MIAAAVSGSVDLGRPDYRAVLLVNEGTASAVVQVSLQGTPTPASWTCFAFDPAFPPTDNQPIGPSGSLPSGVNVIVDTLPPRGVVVWTTPWDEPA